MAQEQRSPKSQGPLYSGLKHNWVSRLTGQWGNIGTQTLNSERVYQSKSKPRNHLLGCWRVQSWSLGWKVHRSNCKPVSALLANMAKARMGNLIKYQISLNLQSECWKRGGHVRCGTVAIERAFGYRKKKHENVIAIRLLKININ